MKMGDVVRRLDIGSSVAEFDEALDKYFVDTEPFRAVILGKADIIAGDKGTGKTAIFRILQKRRGAISELKDVEILPAFNPSGNPIFQRLVQEAALTEQRYISIWKIYIFALVGNWLLEIFEPDSSDSPRGALDRLLRQTNLRSKDDAPATVFSRLMNLFHWWPRPKSAEVQLTVSDAGMPVVTPKVEFADQEASGKTTGQGTADSTGLVRHEDAFQLLNQCLKECGVSVWVALDRLDEAFQGCPDVETPALRALLRTYLDLLAFDCIRLKLFVRRDLFRKVVKGGFVNLTHINARKIEIIWDKDDLLNLLCQRFRESGDLLKILGVENESNEEVFRRIFPDQIDVGDRKPTSWNWIMSRIRDGNDVRPPRNLIDLVTKAREAQLRREDRDPREFMEGWY